MKGKATADENPGVGPRKDAVACIMDVLRPVRGAKLSARIGGCSNDAVTPRTDAVTHRTDAVTPRNEAVTARVWGCRSSPW